MKKEILKLTTLLLCLTASTFAIGYAIAPRYIGTGKQLEEAMNTVTKLNRELKLRDVEIFDLNETIKEKQNGWK